MRDAWAPDAERHAVACRKLDITRRDQLADALTGLLDAGGEDPSATAAMFS